MFEKGEIGRNARLLQILQCKNDPPRKGSPLCVLYVVAFKKIFLQAELPSAPSIMERNGVAVR